LFKKKGSELEETVAQKGSIGTFFTGIVVFAIGLFMVLNNTDVYTARIGSGYSSYLGGWTPPFGVLIIPLLIGIIIVVATDKDLLGTLFVGILTSIDFRFKTTSAYYMVLMFGFIAVGIGLVLKGMFGKS